MTISLHRSAVAATALAALLATFLPARASAIPLYRGFGGPAGFGSGILNGNDDGSTGAIDLTGAFSGGLRFYGGPYTQFWVNNNGNITFSGPVGEFTPRPFPIASRPMIAPYWADIDTRSRAGLTDPAENLVYYHLEPGRLIVTWYNAGYYANHNDMRVSFQLIITNATDCGSGDFDVEFRYDRCEWVAGDASGGSSGHGGTPAQAGFDAGNLRDYTALPGSFTEAVRNVCSTSNVGEPGRWEFSVRAGGVVCREDMPCTVPDMQGACSIGRTQCVSNVAQCQAITTPSTELCDNVDNDCNGVPDDAPGLCGPRQACQLGSCVDACFEGTCAEGYTCDATSGGCVETACVGVPCAQDERCQGGACVGACEGVVCPHGQQCLSGVCVDPCAAVTCDSDRLCRAGLCVLRCPCSPCPVGETCLADGSCLAQGCDIVLCGAGQYCEGSQCHDSCEGVVCPRGQTCELGECALPATRDAGVGRDAGPPDAGEVPADAASPMDAGMVESPDANDHGPPAPPARRGCDCNAAGGAPYAGHGGLALLASLALVAASRRRARRAGRELPGAR